MVARTRTRNSDLQTGVITYASGAAPLQSERWGKIENCQDIVGDMFDTNGNLKDHRFDMTTITQRGHQTTGTVGGGASQRYFLNKINALPSAGAALIRTSSEIEQLRVRLLSSTGPLTPKVNLPLFIFELKDIPMMLKHAGDLLHKIRSPSGLSPHKEAAAATLAYQFGWAPLLGDLAKLIQFSSLVKKKQAELDKANSSRGLQRRMTFPDITDSETTDNVLLVSDCGIMRGSVTVTRTNKAWATVRWKLRSGQRYGRKPSHNEAFRTALGLNLGMIPITVWKALPWSWMIDWFADISNVMQANYNMMFYSPTAINFMENRINESTTSGGSNANGFVTPGSYRKEVKLRSQLSSSSAKVTLRVPFLDTFKLSILSSLAILRLSGKR